MMISGQPKATAIVGPHDARYTDDGRQLVSVRGLLEWAFGAECANLDYDEVGQIGPQGYGARSATANICEMLSLGDEPGVGVRVDSFGGRSYAHDDADLIASKVRAVLPWADAVMVAEHARSGLAPVWDLAATACVPVSWKPGLERRIAKTESLPRKSFRAQGRLVQYTPVICPVHYSPTASQIGAARRAYLAWVLNLLHLRNALKREQFQRFALIDALPVTTPWKKSC